MKRILVGVALVMVLSATCFAADKTISRNNMYGCVNKGDYDTIMGFLVSKDTEAFNKYFVNAVMAGRCIIFKNGETVFLEDTNIMSGAVKVRAKGETTSYWTSSEAIK